tara:strand:+ start:1272 stop:1733 length:462 start_codon:yes stop_codon:yes gene_type:complete
MATLTVTHSEDLTLNGSQQGSTNVKAFTGINEASKRMLTITTNVATIANFSGAVGSAGHWNDGTVKYIRLTNLHATYFVGLTLRNGSDDEFAFKLDAGQSFMLCGDNSTGMELIFNATQAATAGTITAFGPLKDITADAESGTIQIEMFVATT